MTFLAYLCPCIPTSKSDPTDDIEASYQDTVVHGDTAMMSSKIMSIENYDAYVLPNVGDRNKDDLVLVPSLQPGQTQNDEYMDVVVAGEGVAENENNEYLYYRADAEED